MNQHRSGSHLTAVGALNKSLWMFYGPWGGREKKAGRMRRGKVLKTESEWGRVSKFLSPPPTKEAWAEAPEEDFCPGPQTKSIRNEGT